MPAGPIGIVCLCDCLCACMHCSFVRTHENKEHNNNSNNPRKNRRTFTVQWASRSRSRSRSCSCFIQRLRSNVSDPHVACCSFFPHAFVVPRNPRASFCGLLLLLYYYYFLTHCRSFPMQGGREDSGTPRTVLAGQCFLYLLTDMAGLDSSYPS